MSPLPPDTCLEEIRQHDFQLLETLLYVPDAGYTLLDEHVRRMERSARFFGFPITAEMARHKLAQEIPAFEKGMQRVRLLGNKDGGLHIEAFPIELSSSPVSLRLTLSPHHVSSADIFLRHKTTHRDLYNREFARISKEGFEEVLFLNERNEVCEGAISNIFVKQPGQPQLLTPPVTCGLLPGTLRATLLQNGKATEQLLTLENLHKAEQVFMGNSVRGLQPCKALELQI